MQTQVYTEKPKAGGRTAYRGTAARASSRTINRTNNVTMNIVTLSFDMAAAVQQLFAKAKRFYYLVMLLGHRCPKCNGSLTMVAEGRCKCESCKYEFDPTIEFQRCSSCSGIPVLRVRRYQCRKCGSDIKSMFLFDGLVFDSRYFCRKMAESRKRKKQQRQRVQEMLAQCRSGPLTFEAPDLNSVPGLIDALNGLTAGMEAPISAELRSKFDLNRYQRHIKSYLDTEPTDLREIPPLITNLRLDLIWRFIAAIFLDHAGMINVYQQDQNIWVMKN
jgi:hypothetical protein